MKKTVTAIVPTLNNAEGIRLLTKYFLKIRIPLMIVDNGPNEKKEKFFKNAKKTGEITYLPQRKNLGFAASVNKGFLSSDSEWILILNDDIVFKDKDTILKMLALAEKKKADAVSALLVNPNNKIENYGYKVLTYGKIRLFQSRSREEADGLTAACLLIKKKVFMDLGGFDESFFAYLEDVDFFLRFKKAGFRMIQSDIKVIHQHMKTSKTLGNFKARQDMVNWWRLYFKHKSFFRINTLFFVERLRNLSGFLKATFLLKSGK